MTIKLLDDNLINKIAAGEVIEKPASIVKELAENSIDASANRISVKISNAGLDRIEIEDDGEGIGLDELPLAFLRHATSKISREEDLFAISTMGFRGEALPSIASVARVEVFSQRKDQDGIYAFIEGGQLQELKNHPGPEGTRIIIKDLFYNTPARRKFLKSPVSEGNHVHDMICRYALARPDISFSFSNDKRMFFKTPGNGILRDAIIAVYGRDFTQPLIDIGLQGTSMAVSGLISSPGVKRHNRKNQLFFINGRPVRSPLLFRAVDEGYRGLLVSKEHPVVILHISVPLQSLDVNVHPQKSEVRFQDEKTVFKLVCEVLRKSLDNSDYSMPDFTSRTEKGTYYPSPVSKNINTAVYEATLKSFDAPAKLITTRSEHADLASFANRTNTSYKDVGQDETFTVLGQIFNSYILLEKDDTLWVIDQHAAHERILYNQFKEQYASSMEPPQILAFPLDLELSGQEMELIENKLAFFAEMGFELEIMGPNALLIRAVPNSIAGKEKEIIYELLELLRRGNKLDLKDEAIIRMSCKKAIKAGSRLTYSEMKKLIEQLLSAEGYKNCPHGRPTIINLSHQELDRMFKR